MTNLPKNLKLIWDTNIDKIVDTLGQQARTIHATNGTYTKPVNILEGTTLAGFQYLIDNLASLSDDFLIAANSNKSMRIFTGENIEDQKARALKVALPLAIQNPERTITIVFYDQETPKELYSALSQHPLIKTASLHKWGGYGIGKDAPVIIAAEDFDHVLAFPYYDENEKPFCFYDTKTGDQTESIKVVNLYHTEGAHGDMYLRPDNTIKFTPVPNI